ncbi:MAG: hypothetical protein R3A46_11335 [Thermomicrobiales bacterium]
MSNKNGSDGVLFAAEATYPEEHDGFRFPFTLGAFQPMLEAPAEVPTYTPEMQMLLLHAYLVALDR